MLIDMTMDATMAVLYKLYSLSGKFMLPKHIWMITDWRVHIACIQKVRHIVLIYNTHNV